MGLGRLLGADYQPTDNRPHLIGASIFSSAHSTCKQATSYEKMEKK